MNDIMIVELFKRELKDRLAAAIIFGSRLLSSAERCGNDLDLALIIDGKPEIDSFLTVAYACSKIFESAQYQAANVIHGPIIIFSEEPVIINPMLSRILLLSDAQFVFKPNVFENVLLQLRGREGSNDLTFIYKELLCFHLHEMRLCLYSSPKFCSESDEVFIFKYHLIIVMRAALFLKTGIFYAGGGEIWKAWENVFRRRLVDHLPENISFKDYFEVLWDKKTRLEIHATLSLCSEELIKR